MSTVDANYRFIAAAQEANARIAQRQQTLALYVTISFSLIAAMVALSHRADHAGDNSIQWLLLGLPLASLCLVLLNFKTEVALANIRRFLSELEQLGGANEHLPSFNTDARWVEAANDARRYHDVASALLTVGVHAIAISVVIKSEPDWTNSMPFALAAAVAGAVLTTALLLVPRWRYQAPPAN